MASMLTQAKFSMTCILAVLQRSQRSRHLIIGDLIDFVLILCLQAESTSASNESILKVALDHGKASGVIKSHDRVVVCQKLGDSSVVKIIELED